MTKYRVPDGCSSLSLAGESIEIKDGVIEVSGHHDFLLANGFEQVVEEQAEEQVVEEPKAKGKK